MKYIKKEHRDLEFRDNVVIKKTHPDLMKIEVAKMIKGREIGKKNGSFYVPDVYEYDEVNGVLIMERLKNIHGVRNIDIKSKAYEEIIKKSGSALAEIHNELILPQSMTTPLNNELKYIGKEVYIHGDFSVENVCIFNDKESLGIIDWQMTNRHGGASTFGTRYYDIAWFVNNLFSKPIYRYSLGRNVSITATAFLDSYFYNCDDVNCNINDFFKYSENLYNLKIKERKLNNSWIKNLLLLYGHRSWKKFNR